MGNQNQPTTSSAEPGLYRVGVQNEQLCFRPADEAQKNIREAIAAKGLAAFCRLATTMEERTAVVEQNWGYFRTRRGTLWKALNDAAEKAERSLPEYETAERAMLGNMTLVSYGPGCGHHVSGQTPLACLWWIRYVCGNVCVA